MSEFSWVSGRIAVLRGRMRAQGFAKPHSPPTTNRGRRGAQILEIHNDAEGGSHREAHIARSLSPRDDERVLLTPQSPTTDGARVCWNWEPFNSRAHYECRDFAAGSDPRPGPSSGTVDSLCPLGPQTGATWDWTLDTGLGWALRCFCAFSSVFLAVQCWLVVGGWWWFH